MRTRRIVAPALITALTSGCAPEPANENVASIGQRLSVAEAATLGFEDPAAWHASGASLSQSERHVEGASSLAVSQASYAVIASRKLSSLSGVVGSVIGFDLSIPEQQPNESWFGSVQLYADLPSQGLYDTPIGQRELSFLPRESFRRIEFTLSQDLQAKLAANYQNDLEFRLVLNVPAGAGTYRFDRLSFQHEESEPVDDSRNAAILGFETASSWTASAGTSGLSATHTEGVRALSVVPSGHTVLTSARLATPDVVDAVVGFDLMIPESQPNSEWFGDTQLFVDLPSQGVFNVPVGQQALGSLPRGSFARISYTLPPWLVEKLDEPFDDLRFKIVLDTPAGAGAHLLDRFRFGTVEPPRETVDLSFEIPQNIAPDRLALVALNGLSIGSGNRLKGQDGFRPVIANLDGTMTIGNASVVDSIYAAGSILLQGNAAVRGYVAGGAAVQRDSLSQIFGQIQEEVAERRPLTWRVRFDLATTDVTVTAGQSRVLSAGRYRTIRVQSGGVLAFQAGTFHADSLIVEPGGTLRVMDTPSPVVVNVRSRLGLTGTLRDARSLWSLARMILTYAGSDPVTLSELPFDLFAPRAPVTFRDCTAPACMLGGVWAGSIDFASGDASDWILGRGWVRTTVSPVVTVPELTDGVGTHPEIPVTVEHDNPTFSGTFTWGENESGTGTGPYFSNGEWTGITNAFTFFRSELPQLPWRVRGAMLPAGDQSPAMGPLASWQLHGFNLYHGATFQVTRQFRHASGQQIEGGQSLYVRLSDDVLLVPVVLVGWDHEEQANDLKALFDFIPVGTDPMADPRVRGWEPPDNVWERCGIQFIAIRAPWLGEPPPVSPGGSCEPEWYKRDYVTDDELHDRLWNVLGDEDYEVVYGDDGIDPVTIQLGRVRSELDGECSTYEAKADISERTIQVNGTGDAYTIAHELGHILLGEAHLSIPKNLMSDPGQRAGELSEAQCRTARERAAAYSKRYRTALERQGDALPPERPRQPTREFPAAPPTDAIELGSSEACCEIDGRTQKTLRIACIRLDSPIGTCSECCAGDYVSVEMGTCDPDAVRDNAECSTACCELSDGTKLETTHGDCVHNREGTPWPGACAPK